MPKFFIPTYNYPLVSEETYETDMRAIEEKLSEYAVSGLFPVKGGEIAYEYYLARPAKATVVMLHGFTEFPDKYRELAWYMLCMGCNVFIPTMRGHGFSLREVDDLQITHVSSFTDYADDLDAFVNAVVLPAVAPMKAEKLCLFSHSLGGAVAVLYMAAHDGVFGKAVLSSPMVCPSTKGMPVPVMRLFVRSAIASGGAGAPLAFTARFDKNAHFALSGDTSAARFAYNLNKRAATPNYQTSLPSNSWMYQALTLQKKLYAAGGKISSDVLLFRAEHDTAVRRGPQKTLAEKIPHCTLVEIPRAKHTIFTSSNDILGDYLEKVFSFIGLNI